MARTTPATAMLTKSRTPFSLHVYAYDPAAARIGMQAAEALGEDPCRVLKTLMAEVDGRPVCVAIPADRELSMKRLAAAFDGRSAHMLKPSDAERITGFVVGGISPFGQRRRSPKAIEHTALSEPYVYFNGGQRGLQVRLDPQDARACLARKLRS